MAIDSGTGTTRRKVLAAALGAAGAYAVSAIAGVAPVAAVANGNVQLGAGVADTDNDSAAQTQVRGTTDGMVAFSAVQSGSGTGLYGYTLSGTGVLAVGGSSGNGLDARSSMGTGAIGASFSGIGVYGYSGSTVAPPVGAVAGVVAVGGGSCVGLYAQSTSGTGAIGASFSRNGVYGYSGSTAAPFVAGAVAGVLAVGGGSRTGLDARSTTGTAGRFATGGLKSGLALQTIGRVRFDNSVGIATIASGTSSVTVTPGIDLTATSAVVATLQGDAGGSTTVKRVVVNATADTLTIYLTANATAAVKVAWHVFG